MKAVVFAYHNMGCIGIRKLLEAGFDIPLVFTHADSAGENIWFDSVADLCRKLSIPYVTPETVNTPEWIARIKEERPDILFSFYYRLMIAPEILAIPPVGAYNLHGSYLPAFAGRCPVNWVIIKGEQYSGVTLHEMVGKPDAGPIVAQKKVLIEFSDTVLTLFRKLEQAAGTMLGEILPQMNNGAFSKIPQDFSLRSYYGGRRPEDGRIDWHRPASEIYNLIRGVTRPYPGAISYLGEKKLLIWWAVPQTEGSAVPGRIYATEKDVVIGTGSGSLRLEELEIEGRVLTGENLRLYFYNHNGEQLS
jgi:UDP-4-amino-4-deoxy-L-arabinose formyltransferase/UDP-glucuronic acid dehydrogenase (UDP-4-keto-hexauronic acid decarboxylating)